MSLTKSLIKLIVVERDLSPLDRDFQQRGRIRQAFSTLSNNLSKFVLTNLLTLIFALPLLGVFTIWLNIETDRLLDTFSLANGLGIGYAAVDQTVEAINSIYDLRQTFVLYYLAPGIMITSIGLAGCYNVARNFLWGVETKVFKHFFRGIQRHWYKFLISFTVVGLAAVNFVYPLLEVMQQTAATGSASAGMWCWTVFAGIFALLLVVYLVHILPMFVCFRFKRSAAENYKAYISNALVESIFAFLTAVIFIVIMVLPLLLSMTAILSYILYAALVSLGFSFYALFDIAYGQNVSDMYI